MVRNDPTSTWRGLDRCKVRLTDGITQGDIMSIESVVALTMELTGYPWTDEHMRAAAAGVNRVPYVMRDWSESVCYRLAHRLNVLANMGPLPERWMLREILREVRDQGYAS